MRLRVGTMEHTLERNESIVYLRERYKTLTQAEPIFQRKTFTFEDAHRCRHCQEAFITVTIDSRVTVCIDCGWEGVGTLSPDGQHHLCGGCGRRYGKAEYQHYTVMLGYGLMEAVVASQEGCALYELLVDSLVLKSHSQKDWPAMEVLCSPIYRFQFKGTESRPQANQVCILHAALTSNDPATPGSAPQTLKLTTIHAWTTAADPAAKYISSRPYERDVRSTLSMAFAKSCFRECLEKHRRCVPFLADIQDAYRRDTPRIQIETVDIRHVPSRLLDVGVDTEPTQVILAEIRSASKGIRENVSRSGYVTLSYCWGGNQPLSLTKASHQELQDGISLSRLPQTLKDAVWVTRHMGMRYLWIDALCIFQDNDDDKSYELARMAEYYSNAALCICAAAAARAAQGFLHVRGPSSYSFGPVRLSLRDGSGRDAGHVYLLNQSNASLEPTATRGWTLQESLLSRRTLIFAQRQLYWCCVDSYAGCGGEITALFSYGFTSPVTLVERIHPIGSLLDQPVEVQWRTIVHQYTGRWLSCATDKLPAVSALVDYLTRLCSERQTEVAYYAGLLVLASDPLSWPKQLLWHSDVPQTETRRATPYRCPSWSWAAIEGPVHTEGVIKRTTGIELANVKQAHVDLSTPTLPFGSVRGGFLVLETRMCPMGECANLTPILHSTDDWELGRETRIQNDGIHFGPDTAEDGATIEAAYRGYAPDYPVFLVSLYWAVEVRGIDRDREIGGGLVVVPSTSTRDAFTRVGIFYVVEGSRVVATDDDSPPADDLKFLDLFLSHPRREVLLI